MQMSLPARKNPNQDEGGAVFADGPRSGPQRTLASLAVAPFEACHSITLSYEKSGCPLYWVETRR